MQDSVSERVLSIIAATQRIPRDRITLDSSFEELGFDSLDAMNILFALETEFNISVPDDAARSIRSVRAAVEGVQTLVDAQKTGTLESLPAAQDSASTQNPEANSEPRTNPAG
jgi:acyl carrier protein